MWKHYFKSAWRNLKVNKFYSTLNICGLAVGIASALTIFLWIENECSYDTMFSSKDNIFLVENNHLFNGKITTYKTTSPLLAPAVKQEIPQVQYAARAVFYPNILLSTKDKKIYEDGTYADASLFNIFKLKFIYGNAASALANVDDVVLTESAAISFFGKENPIGKPLQLGNSGVCRVSAVIKNFPKNSSFNFSWIANFKLFGSDIEQATWTDNFLETYVKLNDNVSADDVNRSLKNFIIKKDKDADASPFLFSIRKLHLYNSFVDGAATNEGNIRYVRLFAIIAAIILLIACINFMNLSTARSQNRAKEISVRKVFGAHRSSLIKQFLAEAFICSFVAVIIACLFTVAILPFFNRLINTSVDFALFAPLHIVALVIILFGCTFVAGSYPAFYLSAFNPAKTLQQQRKSGFGALFIRKSLVIIQFGVCIILMVATAVIYRQIQYTKNRELGFNKSNLIYTPNSNYLGNTEFLKNKLMASGVVKNVSFGYNTPIGLYNSGSRFYWSGKDVSKNVDISNTAISSGYLSTFGIQMLAGRDFQNTGSDSNSVIINESLARIMGSEGRIGGKFSSSDSHSTIIGIVKDFVFDDMNTKQSKPLVYTFDKENYGQIFIALKPAENMSKSISAVKKIYEETHPSSLFEYRFLDEDFNQAFQTESLASRLSAIFGILAVFISCLGLFGLSAFMAEQRRKEIGIRKALGASIFSITKLLSQDYLKLILIATATGIPVAWLIMNRWLRNYQYRISISGWIFVSVIILSVIIAMATVGYQAIKAARANPVKSLKTE